MLKRVSVFSHKLEQASHDLMYVQAGYAKRGIPLCLAALCGSKDFVSWKHYPENDYTDHASGYEFYYHAHDQQDMPEAEHGHFHVFKRSLKHPEQFIHLIGIALNAKGLPVRLFTTNQWVTGEAMAQAKKVISALKGFKVSPKGRLAPIGKWLTALVTLYVEEMESLIQQRDQWIAKQLATGKSKAQLLDNQKHHVLSSCQIDLIEKLSLLSFNQYQRKSS